MVKTPVKAPRVSGLCQKHEGTGQGLSVPTSWEPHTCTDTTSGSSEILKELYVGTGTEYF